MELSRLNVGTRFDSWNGFSQWFTKFNTFEMMCNVKETIFEQSTLESESVNALADKTMSY